MKKLYYPVLLLTTALLMSFVATNQTEDTLKNNPEVYLKLASESVAVITLSANDQMKFDKKEIKVKAGQTVKLTLVHTGKMAKNVMGHNFVLLKSGTDVSKFGQAAMAAKSTDYIPAGSKQVIAHTKVIGGGEKTGIEFQAPQKGSYTFICSFPGHYAIMQGTFIVE
ncbi:MAG TPA: azurin [Salinimicrobium sp.]|nr:azurin [Salinimicrobium sp.]